MARTQEGKIFVINVKAEHTSEQTNLNATAARLPSRSRARDQQFIGSRMAWRIRMGGSRASML